MSMSRTLTKLAIAVAATVFPFIQFGHVARASGGVNNPQTVALHRQSCAQANVGPLLGSARFSLDDQGGGTVNPGGMEIRTAVTAGMPRTSYGEYILDDSCNVLVHAGTLKTDDSGRGDLDVHVLGSSLPSGAALRVQLVAPENAAVPGPGPFTDVLTSDPTTGG